MMFYLSEKLPVVLRGKTSMKRSAAAQFKLNGLKTRFPVKEYLSFSRTNSTCM